MENRTMVELKAPPSPAPILSWASAHPQEIQAILQNLWDGDGYLLRTTENGKFESFTQRVPFNHMIVLFDTGLAKPVILDDDDDEGEYIEIYFWSPLQQRYENWTYLSQEETEWLSEFTSYVWRTN